jgi:hypothetical protein
MGIRHTKTSTKPDGADASLVQSSDWNAEHALVGQLDIPVVATPAAPAPGHVGVFGRSVAGRILPAAIGPSGLDTSLQPLLARNKIAWANPVGNAVTLSLMGIALTATGTATTASVATTNIHTAIRRLEYAVTTAAVTAVAGFRSAALQYHLGDAATPYGGFFVVCRFGPSRGAAANATRRGFVGLTSNTAAPTDVDPSTTAAWANLIGVGHDAGDANFQLMHRSGTAATTKIDTGIPKAYADASEMFELALFTAPTGTPSVGVLLTRLSDGVTFSRTITTNLPAATQLLTFQAYNSVGGTSSVIGMALASLYIETDY